MVDATAEFLKILRNSEVIGGTMMRQPTGSKMKRYTCDSVKHSASPAAFCPRGKAFSPERNCAHTRAAVNRPRQSTEALENCISGASDLNQSPSALGKSSGKTMYQM